MLDTRCLVSSAQMTWTTDFKPHDQYKCKVFSIVSRKNRKETTTKKTQKLLAQHCVADIGQTVAVRASVTSWHRVWWLVPACVYEWVLLQVFVLITTSYGYWGKPGFMQWSSPCIQCFLCGLVLDVAQSLGSVSSVCSVPPLVYHVTQSVHSLSMLVLCVSQFLASVSVLVLCVTQLLASVSVLVLCVTQLLASVSVLVLCVTQLLGSVSMLVFHVAQWLRSVPVLVFAC